MAESERGGFISRHKKGLALTAAVSTAIVFGPSIYKGLKDLTEDESLIVSGVPGQVEQHTSDYVCRTFLRGSCIGRSYRYYLGIEQCPQDIDAARRGEQTQSFAPETGLRYTTCNFDYVRVSPETYSQTPVGEILIFEGPVGEPLKK